MIVKETTYGGRSDPFIRVVVERQHVRNQIRTTETTYLKQQVNGAPVTVQFAPGPVAIGLA